MSDIGYPFSDEDELEALPHSELDDLEVQPSWETRKAENARRLARYPEAIELLRELVEFTPLADSDDGYCEVYNRIEAFLADEPAEREGGV